MYRKKIEDFKLSGNKTLKISKKDIETKEVPSYVASKEVLTYINPKKESPKYETPYISTEISPKYDFLKKLNKKTATFTQRIPQTPKLPNKKKSFSGKIVLFIIVLLVALSVYLLNTVFFSAKVSIVPMTKAFELNHQKFNSEKNNPSSIPFEVMIVTDTDTKDIVLTSSKEVSDYAKGQITLFNEYSTKPQKIVAGTFISDDKGKSYKLDSTVTIPGYTLEDTLIIPGQISVNITSFLAGDSYNGSPDSFFVTSFKGTTKYQKIYGKIKTPLADGIAGTVYFLNNTEKDDLLSNTTLFKERLLKNLTAQTPEGYIYYPDGVSFAYEFGENILSKTPVAKIVMKGTLSAIIFKESDLSNFLINKSLPNISIKEKSEILPPDLTKLTFNFIDKGFIVSKDILNFNFDLTGNLILNWKPNVDELKGLLVDKNKNEVTSIFKQDPGISSASIKIIPFWSSKLPKEPKNINIIFK
jgi:hypothetical protein